MLNKTTWNEKMFSARLDNWYYLYLLEKGTEHNIMNSLLYLKNNKGKNILKYK